MTEELKYISVRVYREDGNGDALLKGSGTLLEDNGCYYVLTAYHCLEKKLADGTLIPEDLALTKIAFRYNRQDVDVVIRNMVDKDKAADWALISVEQPAIDWSYVGKVKLTRQININTPYESYPYISSYKGAGRYTEVIPLNDEGYCHISDQISSGRLFADTVMKGGSGAGIMLNNSGVLYCFGFMKETLPNGLLNDIKAVCVDDIIPLLSNTASHQFTDDEINQLRTGKIQEQTSNLANSLSQSKSEQELFEVVSELLITTIPALLNNLQDELAKDLLEVISQHCEALFESNQELHAQYLYCKGLYFRLLSDPTSARSSFQEAYNLDKNNEKLIEIEARRLWKDGRHKEALALELRLADDNETAIALKIVSSEEPEIMFQRLSVEQNNSYSLRYKIEDLLMPENVGLPLWLLSGIDLKEPDTLTLENLQEWMFLFTCIHFQVQGIIPLRFEDYPLGHQFSKAYYAARKFFSLAKGTKLENAIPMLEAMYCYWAFLMERDNKWEERYGKIDFSKENVDNQIYGHVLYSSILALMGHYDDAYKNIADRELPVKDLTILFVSALSCVSGNVTYIISLIEKHKEGFLLGQGVDMAFVQMAQVFKPSEFNEVMKRCEFSDGLRPRLLRDYNRLIFKQPYSTVGYDGIDGLQGDMAAVAAVLLFNAGKKEEAIVYLKRKIEQGEHNACEETYFRLIAQDHSHRPEYFEYLQGQRKSGHEMTENQLREEFNFSQMLQDYDNALEVISIIWNRSKQDEWATSAYFSLLGRKGKAFLQGMLSHVLGLEFTKPELVQSVYATMASNGYLDEAAQFLYSNTLRLQDEGLSAYYDQQAIMGYIREIVNRQFKEAIEGSYVLYTTDGGDRHCRRVNEGTVLGEALLGHKKDDELTLNLSGEDKHLKILGVFTKYYYLHYKNMKEVMESGGNAYFKPFKIDTTDEKEAQKQLIDFLEKVGGADERREAIEQYKRGDLGLIHFVNGTEIIGCYYDLLFTDFPRLSIPYGNYIMRNPILFADSCEYLLDITALLLLFEFSLLNPDWKPERKFLLPKFIKEMVLVQQKALRSDIPAGLHKAMSTGNLYRFDDDFGLNLEKRFKALEQWIDNHCSLVASKDILKMEQPVDSPKGRLLSYTLVEFLNITPQHLRVLLSEDFYYNKMFKNMLPLVSTESYMYKKEGAEWGKRFTEFLVMFNRGAE